MKHLTGTYLKLLLCILLIPLASIRDERMHELGHALDRDCFSSGTLRCSIIVGEGLKESYQFGLAYELLSAFCDLHECKLEIHINSKDFNAIDSLRNGSLDIAVLTDAPDTSQGIIQSFRYDDVHTWAVNENCSEELHDINLWLSHTVNSSQEYLDLKKLFETAYSPFKRAERGVTTRVLSPYDRVIRKYAKEIGWDWRMVAAVIYQESRFTINLTSRRGAMGLMQVLPETGRAFGAEDLLDPEQNIRVGTACLRKIQKSYPVSKYGLEESIKFTLAGYNAGIGRIADCKRVAAAKGLDDTIWENVRAVIPSMAEDATVEAIEMKFGKFAGKEVMGYVSAILSTYQAYCKICPRE